jgi:hypothetical protein
LRIGAEAGQVMLVIRSAGEIDANRITVDASVGINGLLGLRSGNKLSTDTGEVAKGGHGSAAGGSSWISRAQLHW